MSASQNKKQRRLEREAGTDKRTVAKLEEDVKNRKSRIRWTGGAIVTILLILVILVSNSNLFYNVVPAVKIGDKNYTNADYQYYYYSAYYQFCNNYSDYLSYFLDTSTPLDEQQFDGTYLSLFGITIPDALSDTTKYPSPTWADYFRETALASMTQITALYENAVADGYTLSDDDSTAIDQQISSFDSYADYYGYASAKKYIAAAYGRGCNADIIRKLLEMNYIASAYSTDQYDSFTYTPAQLSAWYAENKDSYDTFDYMYYLVPAETVEVTKDVTDDSTGETSPQTSQEVTDETMAAAKNTADALAAMVSDEASFTDAVAVVSADATPTKSTLVSGSSLPSAYSEWLLDSSRKTGDVTVAESSGSGYYVVLFLNRGDNSYNTVSVRHILIKAVDTDGDGSYSDEEMAAAKSSIEEIYDEWKSGDATEDSFAALANEKSDDTGSNTNGGLYENVYKGEMVTEFNDFCFAPGRKPGDTAIVQGTSSSYSGYHLVYFVGEGDRYCDYLAENNLRSEDFTKWQTDIEQGYEPVTTFAMKFAAK
jgi:parvulin-like peptidyl-prolyl isomerase